MATQRSKSPRSTRVVAPETPPTAAPPPTGRRKTSTVREWLVISASGWSYLEEAGKHSIMRRTGLPARDLRVLDALLSYPSTILGRERAVVVSLEHIRAIVTSTEVLIPNSKNPLVSSFVQDLKSKVSTAASPSQQGIGTSRSPSFPEFNESPKQSVEDPSHGRLTLQSLISNNDVQENSPRIKMDEARYEGANVLPFELRALEVCLESVCKFLEAETSLLEKEAYPALDELTSNISTLNLERVRQIKSRLVALSGRVQKVGDEIEHLLDDEMDMAEMYLTEKHLRKAAGGSSRFGTCDDEIELDGERDEREGDDERNNESALGFNPDIGELEMLLEAYFVHIDGTLRKLSALREYVDDTEDYLNIMLDDKQNQLLQMGVMLSTATLVTTAAIVVTGIFGMNIHIPLFETQGRFWKTVGYLLGGSVTLYISAIWWGRKSGLLQ